MADWLAARLTPNSKSDHPERVVCPPPPAAAGAAGRPAMPTHQVTNQPPPLVGYDASADPALLAALRAFRPAAAMPRARRGPTPGSPATARPAARHRPPGGRRARAGAGQARQREPAEAAHARPLRPPDRRGGVPPGLARPDDDGDRARPARDPVADQRPGAHLARAAGFYVWGQAEAGHLLPGLDDLRDRPRAAPRPGPGRAVRAAARGHGLRPRPAARGRQAAA